MLGRFSRLGSVVRSVQSALFRTSAAGRRQAARTGTGVVGARRGLCSEGHSDFAPQSKQQFDLDGIKELISKDINDNPVMVYMKGTPNQPQCGFSKTVVDVLITLGYDFRARNVLADDTLRQGIKDFSDWPTVPQVYVDGEFVGGCDIVMEMFKNGELEELLQESSAKSFEELKESDPK